MVYATKRLSQPPLTFSNVESVLEQMRVIGHCIYLYVCTDTKKLIDMP